VEIAMAGKKTRVSKSLVDASANWLENNFEVVHVNGIDQRWYEVRELHELLGIDSNFQRWFRGMRHRFRLQEGRDLLPSSGLASGSAGDGQGQGNYLVSFLMLDSFSRIGQHPRVLAFRQALDDQWAKIGLEAGRAYQEQRREETARAESPLRIRLREHGYYLAQNFATGSFTVLVILKDDLRVSEELLLKHCLPTPSCRRADGLAGQAWHEYRQGKEWAGTVYRRAILGKTIGRNPRVAVYGWQEHRFAVDFFRRIYLPERIPASASVAPLSGPVS
jgi:hypothetical protein